MNVLIAIGGVSGVVVLITSVAVLGRGIFRQVNATEANTRAIRELSGKVETLSSRYNGHETRITVLEDREGRRRAPRP